MSAILAHNALWALQVTLIYERTFWRQCLESIETLVLLDFTSLFIRSNFLSIGFYDLSKIEAHYVMETFGMMMNSYLFLI